MGRLMTLQKAADKYGTHYATLRNWVECGWLRLSATDPMRVNDADMADAVWTARYQQQAAHSSRRFDDQEILMQTYWTLAGMRRKRYYLSDRDLMGLTSVAYALLAIERLTNDKEN